MNLNFGVSLFMCILWKIDLDFFSSNSARVHVLGWTLLQFFFLNFWGRVCVSNSL